MGSISDTCRGSDDQAVRDRAIRLFTFLRELTELRSRTIRSIDQYEKVLWFSAIPRESECYCIAWRPVESEVETEVWVEIKKPRLKPTPKIPEALEPWLDPMQVEDSSLEFPALRERIPVSVSVQGTEEGQTETRAVFRELSDCPEIKAAWEHYVENEWWPWAEEDRRVQVVQKIYTELFSIYQKQQRLGEAYEVVLGLGYLTWKTPNGHDAKRHIITAQTSLTFDALRGIIALGPAGEGAKPALEQDMLEPQERPDPPSEQNAIAKQIEEIGDALWDRVQVPAALKSWTHAVSPRGQFDETLVHQSEVKADPKIHMAPAIILRKRTERSLLRLLEEILKKLRTGDAVPVGVKRLITITDDAPEPEHEKETGEPESERPAAVDEICFPLPANDEQLEIVRRLSTRQGILVQGPPGTGKSHTIANLVSHLLALGLRVLVTSHAARALKVLREKIPREIADLCVILLGDDLAAMQALEDSVRGITDRYNNWDSERNRRDIAQLERRLDEARRREALTLSELGAIRNAETHRHPRRFGTYEGTAQNIATRLRLEEPEYSWIGLRPDENHEPPLSDVEAVELISLLRGISSKHEEELAKHSIAPESIPDPTEFVTLIARESESLRRYEATANHRNDPRYEALVRVPRVQRQTLVQELLELLRSYEAVASHIQPWAKTAATQILAERDRAWRELLNTTKQILQAVGERAKQASTQRISGLGERDRTLVKAHAEALLRHLEAGGRLGFGPFRSRPVKEALYLVKEVRVDGHLCDKAQPLHNLIEWIEMSDHLLTLRKWWAPHVSPPTGTFISQVAEYLDLCEPLESALELHKKVNELRKTISAIPGLREPTWHISEDLRSCQLAAEAVTIKEELDAARRSLEELEHNLRSTVANPNVHHVVQQTLEAVRSRNERRYGDAYQGLCALHESRAQLRRRRLLLDRLEMAAPALTGELKSAFASPVWDTRMAGFTAAWNWARADRWLRRLCDPAEQDRLTGQLDRVRDEIRVIIRDLAAAKAWGHCFSRLTEHERQHLLAWTKAMRRIGKGTGKYARMHRRAAREHMEECRSAIPAWIMPIYRVAETVRPGTDTFDVVIVDEASQSGPEALFLQYLAKKIVVVGDDKQISPEFVGLTREDVELLRQRHISDLPHSDALGVDNSFFDQAEIRFGGRIRLREHFRCMPEIIQFSNNLCYRSEPLVPLRQYGTGRLTPVVVTCHVADGYQKGYSPRVTNPPEAQEIVDQISKCCQDPAYNEKTMGVISLLGEDQARLIEQLLLEKIGPEEIERRHLVCGDAYAFQGDERDVIFLSLVTAPTEGHRIGTLASQRDERRFNVAASRARDQMWLFHTAKLIDLSPQDLRYSLLGYCLNPQVQPLVLEGLNIDELRALARGADRTRTKAPSPFDSWFEVDVFLKVIEHGYRVIPQFEIAGRRIDLLVEGMQGRLAVECYGDAWHGADRYEADMTRERMLERCGLRFWHVWESVFRRNPDTALEGLWSRLEGLGIYTTGRNQQKALSRVPPVKNEKLAHPAPLETAVGKDLPTVPDVEETGGVSDKSPSVARDETESDAPKSTQIHRPRGISIRTRTGISHPLLVPYRSWVPRALPDPRSARVDELVPGLVDIIATEGPVICHRVYQLYARACGIQRVGRQIRSVFNRAIAKALRLRLIEQCNEHETRDQINQIVRKAGTPTVVLRGRGDRTFDEIPPAEIGGLMSWLSTHHPELAEGALFQRILEHYEIRRMTSNIRTLLSRSKERYIRPQAES